MCIINFNKLPHRISVLGSVHLFRIIYCTVMKLKHLFYALCFSWLATSCSETKPAVTVGSEQKGGEDVNAGPYLNNTTGQNNPDFSKYKTYSWASQVRDEQNSSYFLNDLLFKAMVRDAVEHEMASRGYSYQPNGGDLVVNFRVFDQSTTLQTNENLGNGYWANTEPYTYDSRRQGEVKLDPGSIIVQMIDRKAGDQVWQGYASGLTDGNVFNKDKDKVYEAVGAIFERYQYRADKL